MEKEKPAVEKPIVKTREERINIYVKEYADLCKRHGFKLNHQPQFKLRDDGTYSVVLQDVVEEFTPTN